MTYFFGRTCYGGFALHRGFAAGQCGKARPYRGGHLNRGYASANGGAASLIKNIVDR